MKYLNEERYQKTNKGIKVVGIIIMLIGLALLGVGIYRLATAPSISVTNIQDNMSNMAKRSSAMFILIPGIFLTILGGIIGFVLGNQRNIMAYQVQSMMPIMQESMEQMTPAVSKMMDDLTPAAQRRAEAMAPSMGVVAEEIARGIKEGLKEE